MRQLLHGLPVLESAIETDDVGLDALVDAVRDALENRQKDRGTRVLKLWPLSYIKSAKSLDSTHPRMSG